MSRNSLYVLFPNGDVRYGLFNGTACCVWPKLFDTLDEAWEQLEAYRKRDWEALELPKDYDTSTDEAVRIYSEFDSYEVPGRATRDFITSDLDWNSDMFYDMPKIALPVGRKTPEWIPQSYVQDLTL